MTETTNDPEPADIVVAIDDSPSSLAALNWAAKFARSSGDRLRAVHVLSAAINSPLIWTNSFPTMAYVAEIPEPETAKEALTAMFATVAPEPSWTLEFRHGPTRDELIEASASARLLVVGTREHVGLGRLINGSISHFCLTHAPCPVAAIPPSQPLHEHTSTAGRDLADATAAGSAQ